MENQFEIKEEGAPHPRVAGFSYFREYQKRRSFELNPPPKEIPRAIIEPIPVREDACRYAKATWVDMDPEPFMPSQYDAPIEVQMGIVDRRLRERATRVLRAIPLCPIHDKPVALIPSIQSPDQMGLQMVCMYCEGEK